jgi:two-component system, LytTR family, response regulator
LPLISYKCIIVDDDEIDRLTVLSFAKRFSVLQVIAVYANAEEALKFLEKEKIDVLFLDIDMPGLNGIDFRKRAMEVPICIYITAHPEFAVESFELDTLDYIVKPVKLDRLTQTVNRIAEYMELKQKATLFESSVGDDIIYVKEGHSQTKIKLHNILYVEGLKDYTKIVTKDKKHFVLTSIGNLLKENHFQNFIRIHRSFAVQEIYIERKQANELLLNDGTLLPIGRSYKDALNFRQ